MVIHTGLDHGQIIVRFPMPVLGSDEWNCRSTAGKVGDRVQVIDILGNDFVVQPHTRINTRGFSMSVSTIVVLALFAFIGTTIFKGVRIVYKGYKWIVQRLGKYHTTLRQVLTLSFRILMKLLIKSQPKILF